MVFFSDPNYIFKNENKDCWCKIVPVPSKSQPKIVKYLVVTTFIEYPSRANVLSSNVIGFGPLSFYDLSYIPVSFFNSCLASETDIIVKALLSKCYNLNIFVLCNDGWKFIGKYCYQIFRLVEQ